MTSLGVPAGKQIAIDEVLIDSDGWLFIKPHLALDEHFEFIWRDASGIRWNTVTRSLIAYESVRWQPADLYQQILHAVRNEYGQLLNLTPDTRWVGVPADLRAQMEAFRLK